MTFSVDIARFAERTGLSMDTIVRKVAFDVFEGLLARSPVDTGRYRANHRVGVNKEVTEATDATQKTGTPTEAVQELSKAKAGDIITFTNNLPYALRIEQGWSQQAPEGVYALTFQQVKHDLGNALGAVS